MTKGVWGGGVGEVTHQALYILIITPTDSVSVIISQKCKQAAAAARHRPNCNGDYKEMRPRWMLLLDYGILLERPRHRVNTGK